MVTLDLEYCEEVASTSSPNNPAARDDLGTMAAQRQANLADNLYPFKLVYDDGTERLGCDSARERGELVDFCLVQADMQYVGSMPFGMPLREPGVDLLREHHRYIPNVPYHKSHEVMLADLLPLSILHLPADRLCNMPVHIDPCTLPMTKSLSLLVDSSLLSLNEVADDLLPVVLNEIDRFDGSLVKPIYQKMPLCLSVRQKGDRLRVYSICLSPPILLDPDLGQETLPLQVG
jgi:hypothetical protein